MFIGLVVYYFGFTRFTCLGVRFGLGFLGVVVVLVCVL